MADDANRSDPEAEEDAGHSRSADWNRADPSPSYTDMNARALDVDSYATMIYQANLELMLADAQIEYNTTPELRDLLAQASAAATVRRRRTRRM